MDEKSIWLLTEREKELECMYLIDDVLRDRQLSLPMALNKIVEILPSGFAQTEASAYKLNCMAFIFHMKILNRQHIFIKHPSF